MLQRGEAMPDVKPNISATGADNRRRMGVGLAIVSVASLGASIAFALPWFVRVPLVGVPAAFAAVYLFQAHRMTCVVRAGEGVFEGDDLSTVPALPEDAAASRDVARGIVRDSVLTGVLGGAVAAATTLIR